MEPPMAVKIGLISRNELTFLQKTDLETTDARRPDPKERVAEQLVYCRYCQSPKGVRCRVWNERDMAAMDSNDEVHPAEFRYYRTYVHKNRRDQVDLIVSTPRAASRRALRPAV